MFTLRKIVITVYLALSFEVLLWKLSKGNGLFQMCGNMKPGYVLLNQSIQSFYGIIHKIHCIDHCQENTLCRSINWFQERGLCQLNNNTHLSYPEGFVVNVTGDYMIYGCHPMATCSNKMCAEPKVCLVNEDGINFRCRDNCTAALGMQDGRIQDSQITSKSNNGAGYEAFKARLYTTRVSGAWVVKKTDEEQWLQIDLLKEHIISHVATQGREVINYHWVTKYYLMFTDDSFKWQSYNYGNSKKDFQGNVDKSSVVKHKLPAPIKTRIIRFVPLESTDYIAMRVELYGCIA